MLLGLIIFCAAAVAFLVGITMHTEFHDSWARPEQRAVSASSRVTRQGSR